MKIITFDCETSGLDPLMDQINEISFLARSGGEIVDQLDLKISMDQFRVPSPRAIYKNRVPITSKNKPKYFVIFFLLIL